MSLSSFLPRFFAPAMVAVILGTGMVAGSWLLLKSELAGVVNYQNADLNAAARATRLIEDLLVVQGLVAEALEGAASGQLDEEKVYIRHSRVVTQFAAMDGELGRLINAIQQRPDAAAAIQAEAERTGHAFDRYRAVAMAATDIAAVDTRTARRNIVETYRDFADFFASARKISDWYLSSVLRAEVQVQDTLDKVFTKVAWFSVAGIVFVLFVVYFVTRAQSARLTEAYLQLKASIAERERNEAMLQQELIRHEKTARELLEARIRLAEADRLEAVGRLAAGVAHEVKNPLAIIRLGVDHLSKQFARESNQVAVFDDVHEAINRADNIIKDLLDFSRQKSLARRPTRINQVLDNAIHLVRYEIEPRNIDIVRSYDDSIPTILVDPDLLAQVFINLLLNAAQAIGRDGSIEVVARSGISSERDLERDETGTFRIGERVVTAEIRDSGSGVPPGQEKRLFEPFFTTKPMGEGTGLGLAVSRNIVIMHEGSIDISNRPEGGASALLMFRVNREHSANEEANTGS